MLVERSLAGWQEFELEVMCDAAGNCVVVCSIENLDPIGVHTGDSWTVAPQQTLDDAAYQRLRDAAFACARTVGVATGGANVQFAVDPASGDFALIEMNPRVSRSSALASKATGFPIAKLAALLAVGYTLDELPNDITGRSSAAFEPALDYVAVKAPRFDFEKFPGADRTLGTEMRAIGESLGLGRTFPEALLKALEGLEARRRAARRSPACTRTSPRSSSRSARPSGELVATGDVAAAKRFGLPDARIARLLGLDEPEVRARRDRPGRLAVDSCAAEFEARTPYYYLSHEQGDPVERAERARDRRPRLRPEPDRPGHRVRLLLHPRRARVPAARLRGGAREREPGDRLDRLRHVRPALPRAGDARARARRRASWSSRSASSSSSAARRRCGSRTRWPRRACRCSATRSPRSTRPRTAAASRRSSTSSASARRAGAPPRRRPRRGRSPTTSATRCSSARTTCSAGAACASRAAQRSSSSTSPSLVDEFLAGAIELDVDALADGDGAWVAAILEHVERAGVHSGDSACVLPAPSVTPALEDEIRELVDRLARRLGARGLLNLQLALARRRALRAGGEPARVADGAVRREGARPAARRPRLPAAARRAARRRSAFPSARRADARLGEGGDLPVRPLRRRRRPRRRDALDRRGDGRRRERRPRPTAAPSAPPAARAPPATCSRCRRVS